ncbi:hypothetical protein D3C78_1857400 [compost metagenome]
MWSTKTCPPRSSSCKMAVRMISGSKGLTVVFTGWRSRGGVVIKLMSRAPESAR